MYVYVCICNDWEHHLSTYNAYCKNTQTHMQSYIQKQLLKRRRTWKALGKLNLLPMLNGICNDTHGFQLSEHRVTHVKGKEKCIEKGLSMWRTNIHSECEGEILFSSVSTQTIEYMTAHWHGLRTRAGNVIFCHLQEHVPAGMLTRTQVLL